MQADLFESSRAKSAEIPQAPQRPARFSFLDQKHIILRLDQLFVGLIAMGVGGALLYGAGVECGRQMAFKDKRVVKVSKRVELPAVALSDPPPPSVAQLRKAVEASEIEVAPAGRTLTETLHAESYSESRSEHVTTRALKRPHGGYTIQIATYKAQEIAERSVQTLVSRGMDGFVLSSGSFYQVCIHEYEDRKLASRRLSEMKTKGVIPKDAYVRVVPA